MYAWSRFAKEVNEWGQVVEWVEPGDSISQSDIDVSNDEWQDLQDMGAVRKDKYPADLPAGTSPAQYYRDNPDMAPEVAVDEETPQPEAMQKTDTGLAMGMKPPGAEDAEKAAEKQAKAEEKATGGTSSSSK